MRRLLHCFMQTILVFVQIFIFVKIFNKIVKMFVNKFAPKIKGIVKIKIYTVPLKAYNLQASVQVDCPRGLTSRLATQG